jgi:hypothetical protein
VQVVDPVTGQPFAGRVIPLERISPQAAALLAYYPQPTIAGTGYNYQAAVVTQTRQDSVQSRLTQQITPRTQLAANVQYQHSTTRSRSLFGFEDETGTSGLDAQATLFKRISQFMSVRFRYQYTRLTNTATPHFADDVNVSGLAGIAGNNQDPQNFGPPALVFSSGLANLSTAQHAFTRNQSHLGGAELFLFRGRHSITLGGDARRSWIDIESQQDPRGTFTFTATPTSTSAPLRTTPTSPTTGGSGHR